MKKYSKLMVAAIVAIIFIGTFVFLYQKSPNVSCLASPIS